MIYTLAYENEVSIEQMYHTAVQRLEAFFELGWQQNKPKLFLVRDRVSINKLVGNQTPQWLVGWVQFPNAYVLAPHHFRRDSSFHYSVTEYAKLITHELAHLYTQAFSGRMHVAFQPDWLWEGLALYLAEQLDDATRPKELNHFLAHYTYGNKSKALYQEAGWAVKLLVERHGPQLLKKLILQAAQCNSAEEFAAAFQAVYGVPLCYEHFR